MKHYGDITKICGADVPLVDIICGGSPCQDLSTAGLRKGLSGERSALFMEQIRIVKEQRNECIRQLQMRGSTIDFRCIRPRYMVWENVPGAFSSNKGEDFRTVLEEIARIADQDAVIPGPPGKWTPSGCIMGNGWSIAWRVHDAQFWGVPQRRKRIALVADFGGHTAPEILFERESVPGDIETSTGQGQGIAADTKDGTCHAISFIERAGCEGGVKEYLYNEKKPQPCQPSITSQSCDTDSVICVQRRFSTVNLTENGVTPTLEAGAGEGGNNMPLVMEKKAVCVGNGQLAQARLQEKVGTLNCMHDQQAVMVNNSLVRRLTPLECERLQGYPDGWTDIGEWVDSKGKKHKDADSPRYKALGNSIALPFWEWMARRICDQYDEPVEMASLFDGIGGFPLVFSRCGATPVWASEIEEFPIAVTKKRFGDE